METLGNVDPNTLQKRRNAESERRNAESERRNAESEKWTTRSNPLFKDFDNPLELGDQYSEHLKKCCGDDCISNAFLVRKELTNTGVVSFPVCRFHYKLCCPTYWNEKVAFHGHGNKIILALESNPIIYVNKTTNVEYECKVSPIPYIIDGKKYFLRYHFSDGGVFVKYIPYEVMLGMLGILDQ